MMSALKGLTYKKRLKGMFDNSSTQVTVNKNLIQRKTPR